MKRQDKERFKRAIQKSKTTARLRAAERDRADMGISALKQDAGDGSEKRRELNVSRQKAAAKDTQWENFWHKLQQQRWESKQIFCLLQTEPIDEIPGTIYDGPPLLLKGRSNYKNEIKKWQQICKEKVLAYKLCRQQRETQREISDKDNWDRDVASWMNSVCCLMSQIEGKREQEMQRLQEQEKQRDIRKRRLREERRLKEEEEERHKAALSEKVKAEQEVERRCQEDEVQQMRRAEDEQTACADRFWGILTKNEQMRKIEMLRRMKLELHIIEYHAMMVAVGEVEPEETEDLEEVANILKLPQYALRTFLV